MTHRDAYTLLLVVALIWAGNFPLAKLGLGQLGPLTLAAARALIAAPLLVLASRLLEGPLPPLARRDWTAAIVLAATGFAGNSTLLYLGLLHTSPARPGIPRAPGVPGGIMAGCWATAKVVSSRKYRMEGVGRSQAPRCWGLDLSSSRGRRTACDARGASRTPG